MATAQSDILLGYKDQAWFTANPTLVLAEGQHVYLGQTGIYKIGDGSTQLNSLVFQADVVQRTGTALAFDRDSNYGTVASPETGNITANLTGARLGRTVVLIHNNGSEPTFAAAFKKLSGSGDYMTGEINYIACQYVNDTEIVYSINQRT